MQGETALHIIAAQCGTTLTAARKSPGYRSLLRRNGRDPDAAILDYLGDLLIDKAKACLPPLAHKQAECWPDLSPDEKIKALRWLMNTLQSPPNQPEDEGEDKTSTPAAMLPAEMGPWEKGMPRRTCFAISLLVIAFLKMVGVQFFVASVQRPSAEPVTRDLETLFGRAYQLAEAHLPLTISGDPFPAILQEQVAKSIEATNIMTILREFHAAVIALVDGQWVSLDIYMNNFVVFDPATRPISKLARLLMSGPDRCVSILGNPAWNSYAGFDRSLKAIEELLKTVASGKAIAPGLSLLELPGALRRLAREQAALELVLSDEEILFHAVCDSQAVAPEDQPDNQKVRELIATGEHGPDREKLRQRIVLGVIKSWAEQVFADAENTKQHAPHSAMIMSHTVRTIICWAVVNVRDRLGSPYTADLLRLTASDAVLFGALCDRDSLPNGLPADEEVWLQERLSVYLRAPEWFLHPLLLGKLRPESAKS